MRGLMGPPLLDPVEFFLLYATEVGRRVGMLSEEARVVTEAMEGVLEWRTSFTLAPEMTLSASERAVGCEASESSPAS